VNLFAAIVHLPDRDAAGGPSPGAPTMGVTMPLADRRPASHLQIVGEQLGIFNALEPPRVRELSPVGMLLESPNPLAVGSIHEFRLIDGTTSVRVRAAVRHLSPLRKSRAERYFLVLEFINLEAVLAAEVERLLNQWPARSAPEAAEVEH
jgi:hypothetical protein